MGSGASTQLIGGASPTKRRRSIVQQDDDTFTSIKLELEKPLDGNDVLTPRSANAEVKRLRKMLYSGSKRALLASKDVATADEDKIAVENTLLYGHKDGATATAEGQSVEHMDDFDERRARKKTARSRNRKHESHLKDSAKKILDMLEVTHKLATVVADSVSVGKGTAATAAEDAKLHVQSLIHSDYHDREVAVIVSDLSGFTSTTRKYGIVHFASVIVRMRQLVLPIFAKYNALNITTEADNFITIFPDAVSAVSAAVEMQQVLLKYNASLTEERNHFRVRLNGIGVACGVGVLLDTEGKLHGAPANHAYHIGEDICENGVVLVTSEVEKRINEDARYVVLLFHFTCFFPPRFLIHTTHLFLHYVGLSFLYSLLSLLSLSLLSSLLFSSLLSRSMGKCVEHQLLRSAK